MEEIILVLKDDLDDIIKLLASGTKVKNLVESYRNFLNVNHSEHVKFFERRLCAEPESARAEVVIFSFLKENLDNVRLEEDSIKGGVDFRCKTDCTEFVVEVTCLVSGSVTRASRLPNNEMPETGSGGDYRMITQLLRKKASHKASQMSDYDCPRVLVITSEHSHASIVLDCRAASNLLTGETKIAISNTPSAKLDLATELEDSVFFRLKNGKLESCRRSISAILLCSISRVSAFVVGVLHPDPACKFPTQLLSSVPFVGLKEWPPESSRIWIEWQNQETQDLRCYRFWYDERFRLIQ